MDAARKQNKFIKVHTGYVIYYHTLTGIFNKDKAKEELKRCTAEFCFGLESIQIPYLLEFSGNRGFHIWVTFKGSVEYRAGFEFQQAILEQLDITYDEQLVALDLFPKTANPTSGIGNGVKIPL